MGLISGLMEFRPFLRVAVNGVPLSGLAFSELSSCRITDTVGLHSDTVELTWANVSMFAHFGMPQPGAEISVEMGYPLSLRKMGLFVADEVEESSPPRQIRVIGKAKVQGNSSGGMAAITQQKTRSWKEGMTLGDIGSTIASDNGLKPAITEAAASIVPGHLDQIDESDISLITRLAAKFDLVAKPAGGSLFVGKRGAGVKASGAPTPTVPLFEGTLSRWSMRRGLGPATGTVIATYRDLEQAKDLEVKIGDKEPERRLRQRFRSKEEARTVAESEARRASRAVETLEFETVGNTSIVAEGRVMLAGCSSAADGLWSVESVTHEVSSAGFKTSARATRPK